MKQHHICDNSVHCVATTLKIARLVHVYYGIQWENMQLSELFFNEIDMDFVTSLVSPRPRLLEAFISIKKRQKNIDKMDVKAYRFAVLTHFCDLGFHRSFDNMT